MLSKLENERSLDHLVEGPGIGCPREGIRQSTGGLPGRRGFLYRSGDRPRGGFRYRCGNEGLLFSQRWTQVGPQGCCWDCSTSWCNDYAIVVGAAAVVVTAAAVVVAAVVLVVVLL